MNKIKGLDCRVKISCFALSEVHNDMFCLLQLFGRRRKEENGPTCWVGVKVFGNELSVFTCDDLYAQIDQLSLSVAGLAVKLLKVRRR